MAAELPLKSDASLVLTLATPEERVRTWRQTHPMWGSMLSLDDYLFREAYLTTVPLAMDGGLTHWILTDGRLPPNERPILSSCESLRKPALVAEAAASSRKAGKPVKTRDGVCHGIGSVFTDARYRGRGYAGRMLEELGPKLAHWQTKGTKPEEDDDEEEEKRETANKSSSQDKNSFSILYSDIGKAFYTSKGWPAFPSMHLSFPPQAVTAATSASAAVAPPTPIGYHELAELCSVDERLLRARLARRARRAAAAAEEEGGGAKAKSTCVALVPNLPSMLWHLMREDYMTKHIFGRTPTVRGGIVGGEKNKGHRLWALWTRGYYGGLEKIEDNTLHILRVVLEDVYDDPEDHDDPEADEADEDGGDSRIEQRHIDGFRALIDMARAEAVEWKCSDVQLWNPTAAVKALVEQSGLPHTVVEREKGSIASLMWYGEGSIDNVDWVANEKYGWC